MVHDHDLYCMRSYKYHVRSRAICTRPASAYCVFPCGASVVRNREAGFPLKWVSYPAKRKEIQLNQQFQRLIVGSRYMKQELLQNGFAEAKIVIHPPVPESTSEIESASQPGQSEGNFIIYVGQIIRGKGVDVLLESLAQVKVPFECLIIGEGSHRRYCEKLSHRLGLDNCVHFLGFVPREKLRNYFTHANVSVVSSVWPEPFGAAGLEAMRYGLPVVGFDAGAIREWLISGYNGFLVPWMDRAQFAARVQELLTNKALARQLGERGARLVAQRFGFLDYITALEKTLNDVRFEAQMEVNA
jgi:glycosyltransferase involved in cell wall biosynthesis